jgi:carboxyl-terminal processing protease
MRHLLIVLSVVVLALPGFCGEPPAAVAEKTGHAAAIAKALDGLKELKYDEVWDRGDQLRRLGPEAGDALAAALEGASDRGKLLVARQLLNIRGFRQTGAKGLLALAKSAGDRKLRVWAANSLGQSTSLVSSRWLLDALEKVTEGEKDKLLLVALHRARGRLGDDDSAATSLMIMMRRNKGGVRKEAALALGEIGRAVLPEVRRELLLIFRNDPTARADRALSIYRSNWTRDPLFTEVLRVISARYDAEGKQADKIQREKLVRAAVRGMVGSLDPFSSYMDADEGKRLRESLTGEYGGIGAYVNLVEGVFTIISPIYGGPAHKIGLRSMDRVLEVDGTKTSGEGMRKTISRLKGKPNTDVKVMIFRRGWSKPKEFTITRGKISVDSVFSEMLPGKIGYARLVRFAPKTPAALHQQLTALKEQGMKGLILDLRDNPGGYLLSAVRLADEFLPAGKVIVSSKGRRVKPSVHRSTGAGRFARLPLVVLVSSGSASASEILAGALRDNKRAALVGEKTYGKGSVQEPIPLRSEPGALLKLTVAKYYLPGGECIHEKGIKPDVEILSEGQRTPGWKYEELGKVLNDLEKYALAAYKQQPELFRRLAEDDGGKAERYPGLVEKVKALKARAHISAEDCRPYVRRTVRRLAADDRKRRFVSNMEDDRQLKKAAVVLFGRLRLGGALPAPYGRYARAFEAEARKREAQASGRLGLPQEGK